MLRAVIDTSSLISLAWSGLLPLLGALPLRPVVLDGVYAEAVTAGLDRGHADAAAIEHALWDAERLPDPVEDTVDRRVVAAAATVGLVITNDVVLGRRASTLGARWLRTADLVVLGRRTSRLDTHDARAAVLALHAAGRLTDRLRDAYLEELP